MEEGIAVIKNQALAKKVKIWKYFRTQI